MFKYLTTPLKFKISNIPSTVIDPTKGGGGLFMLKKSDLKTFNRTQSRKQNSYSTTQALKNVLNACN